MCNLDVNETCLNLSNIHVSGSAFFILISFYYTENQRWFVGWN